MTVNNLVLPLPEGMKLEQSKVQAHFSGLFPIDLSKDVVEESYNMTMSMTAKGKPDPDGPEIVVESVAEQGMNVKTTHPN